MAFSKKQQVIGLFFLGIVLISPPILAYITPTIVSPNYEFIDTSVEFTTGVNSFASYENDSGTIIIGGSQDGMFVYRLLDEDSYSIFTNSSGQSSSIFDLTDWAYSPYTPIPSILSVMNRTPVVIGKMTELYYTSLFSISDIYIDDEVMICSNADITRAYVTYRQNMYVYNMQGEQISMANLSTLQYGQIESIDSGLNKVLITTESGFGVYDPIENKTLAYLKSLGEVYRARPAAACENDFETIYIGRKDGLHVYSKEETDYIEDIHLTTHQGLPSDSITTLWLDHAARILYIGTESGLVVYDTVDRIITGLPLKTTRVNAVYSKNDAVLAATDSGVYILNKAEFQVHPNWWQTTSTFWIQIYVPGLAFITAWIAITIQCWTSGKKDE